MWVASSLHVTDPDIVLSHFFEKYCSQICQTVGRSQNYFFKTCALVSLGLQVWLLRFYFTVTAHSSSLHVNDPVIMLSHFSKNIVIKYVKKWAEVGIIVLRLAPGSLQGYKSGFCGFILRLQRLLARHT